MPKKPFLRCLGFLFCHEQGCAVALPSICAGNGKILIAVEALPGWVYALIWFGMPAMLSLIYANHREFGVGAGHPCDGVLSPGHTGQCQHHEAAQRHAIAHARADCEEGGRQARQGTRPGDPLPVTPADKINYAHLKGFHHPCRPFSSACLGSK